MAILFSYPFLKFRLTDVNSTSASGKSYSEVFYIFFSVKNFFFFFCRHLLGSLTFTPHRDNRFLCSINNVIAKHKFPIA